MLIKNKKGFTLVELLTVITIIGILSTLAIASLNKAKEKSRDARRISDIKQIRTSLGLYYVEKGEYPNEITAAGDILGETNFMCLSDNGFEAVCTGIEYMKKIPSSPISLDGVIGVAAGNCSVAGYRYNVSLDRKKYSIEYCLGSGKSIQSNTQGNVACAENMTGCVVQ